MAFQVMINILMNIWIFLTENHIYNPWLSPLIKKLLYEKEHRGTGSFSLKQFLSSVSLHKSRTLGLSNVMWLKRLVRFLMEELSSAVSYIILLNTLLCIFKSSIEKYCRFTFSVLYCHLTVLDVIFMLFEADECCPWVKFKSKLKSISFTVAEKTCFSNEF